MVLGPAKWYVTRERRTVLNARGGPHRDATRVWRVVVAVGGILLLIGGAALVVGLVADTLAFVWLSIPPMTLALPLLIVGVVGYLATTRRSGTAHWPRDPGP